MEVPTMVEDLGCPLMEVVPRNREVEGVEEVHLCREVEGAVEDHFSYLGVVEEGADLPHT